jgi:septation ring formation regulator EzrA
MERAGTRAAAILAAGLVAAAAAGCGGGGGGSSDGRLSKSEYEQKLKAEGSRLKAAFSASNIEQSSDVKDLSAKVSKLQQELDKTATDLDGLEPPTDAAADNAKLAEVLHKAADKFGELKQAAQDQDQQRLQQLSQDIAGILQEGQTASDDLKKKGYDIGTLGEN